MGRKSKKRRKQENQNRGDKTTITYHHKSRVDKFLHAIAQKRTGGATNIKGLGFQFAYTCDRLLKEFCKEESQVIFRLEGIEDLDIVHIGTNEFIQIKSSINKTDAGTFWQQKVLQNFFDVFKVNREVKLKFVHDNSLTKGKLSDLRGNVSFWIQKFNDLGQTISHDEMNEFVSRIEFTKVSKIDLIESSKKLLLDHFNISVSACDQVLFALFFNVFQWSQDRASVQRLDIQKLIQDTVDSISQNPRNEVLEERKVHLVNFEPSDEDLNQSFWEGKATRPYHIANGLPIERPYWTESIMEAFDQFNVVLIKSSSGQGKSTLLWQTGKQLTTKGYSLYQINQCSNRYEAVQLHDFILSRLEIGQAPVLVIDGLDHLTSSWFEFATLVEKLPVKVLITSREEDWKRYKGDTTKSRLSVIDIYTSYKEAGDIFRKLNEKSLISSSIDHWQSAWERVEEKKLLIEYIFLLTRGQMLHERIDNQVRNLNRSVDSKAKLETLRLVSTADILGIKLKTRKLLKHIQMSVGFKHDPGESIMQLEKEYYLKFGEEYIEGLHPVRSQHLFERLHSFLSVDETFITVFSIAEVESTYSLFGKLSELIKYSISEEAFLSLARLTLQKGFIAVNDAIAGLMSQEPQNYYLHNKEQFDSGYNTGGLPLLIQESTPFAEIDFLSNIQDIFPEANTGIQKLLDAKEKLSQYSFESSDVMTFARSVAKEINNANSIKTNELAGIGSLIKWFKIFDINLKFDFRINETALLSLLTNNDFEDVKEAYVFFQNFKPKAYKAFIENNKQRIISYLKEQTDTPSIWISEDELFMEYIMTEHIKSSNDESVSRIETVSSFLPYYNKYNTKAIVLPFPNEEFFKYAIQDSIKSMPKANVGDNFKGELNRIWIRTISDNFRAKSSYEWQLEIIELRKCLIEFGKTFVRVFEDLLEGKTGRLRKSTENLTEKTIECSGKIKLLKDHPDASFRNYKNRELYHNEQKIIRSWVSSFNNFLNQYPNLINPQKANDQNVARINIQECLDNLSEFQVAYREIMSDTHTYFDPKEIDDEEFIWYTRLIKTVAYYLVHQKDLRKIGVAKNNIENWWVSKRSDDLKRLKEIIELFEYDSEYIFTVPKFISRIEGSDVMMIGIENFDISSLEEDLLEFILGFSELGDIEVDYFTFVIISEGFANHAFRVPREFFQRIQSFELTGEFEETEFGNPLPIILNQEMLEALENVKYRSTELIADNEQYSELMISIWKLSEYRRRIDTSEPSEKLWQERVENSFMSSINRLINRVNENQLLSEDEIRRANMIVQDLSKSKIPTQSYILECLNIRLNEIIKGM